MNGKGLAHGAVDVVFARRAGELYIDGKCSSGDGEFGCASKKSGYRGKLPIMQVEGKLEAGL